MDTKATNVLLVEDDPVTRKLVRRILTRSGQKRRLSLETAVRIHNSRPDVSIVVLTGSADIEMKQKARNRRADAYLIKSTDVWKSLVLHIRDAIERKKGIEILKNGGAISQVCPRWRSGRINLHFNAGTDLRIQRPCPKFLELRQKKRPRKKLSGSMRSPDS